ncbi:MAG: hypothetical protein GEU80_04475 [Dehalococcoidia bacterium]|nr:hypothetical protein [Dehalococcoidia bacterium]
MYPCVVRASIRARMPFVLVALLSLVTLALIVVPRFADRAARAYQMRQLPLLFYQDLEPAGLLGDYSSVLGVAHNSGNSMVALKRALDHQDGAIEIDVVSDQGVLRAAHRPPVRYIGRFLLRSPTLEDVWEEASGASLVKLDLKESSPLFVRRVLDFLDAHPQRTVAVSSPYIAVLEAFQHERPQTIRMLSIRTQPRLDQLLTSPDELRTVHGVTIHHSLLDAQRMDALHDAGLLIAAWTVNDLDRLNELVELGVHAVTTDNLAITELLGGDWLPWEVGDANTED